MPTMLITGANRGLGLEMARQFGEDGWRIYACSRSPDASDELSRIASQSSGATTIHRLDVAIGAQIRALAAELQNHAIDVLVNNAGILGHPLETPEPSAFGTLNYDIWSEVLKVNTLAPMQVSEEFVNHVAASELKLMFFMSSHMGSITNLADSDLLPYRSSKAALNLLVKALSIGLGERGVRTIAVHPGWVSTDAGTSAAPLTPPESIAGIRSVLAGYGPDRTGEFYQYDGEKLPW